MGFSYCTILSTSYYVICNRDSQSYKLSYNVLSHTCTVLQTFFSVWQFFWVPMAILCPKYFVTAKTGCTISMNKEVCAIYHTSQSAWNGTVSWTVLNRSTGLMPCIAACSVSYCFGNTVIPAGLSDSSLSQSSCSVPNPVTSIIKSW